MKTRAAVAVAAGKPLEIMEVDLEGLSQLQQELDRHRALVVLDQVEVAGRDAELLRHLRLGQVMVAPQPADLVAQHRLLVRSHSLSPPSPQCRKIYKLYGFTASRKLAFTGLPFYNQPLIAHGAL